MPRLTGKDLRAIKKKAMKGDIKDLVSYLKSMLGSRITTYVSGRSDAAVLDLWISGREAPTAVEELRLRYAYQAAAIIVSQYEAETAKAMFLGTNQYLNDEAPASWLRDHENEKDFKEVVSAALSFGEMGS